MTSTSLPRDVKVLSLRLLLYLPPWWVTFCRTKVVCWLTETPFSKMCLTIMLYVSYTVTRLGVMFNQKTWVESFSTSSAGTVRNSELSYFSTKSCSPKNSNNECYEIYQIHDLAHSLIWKLLFAIQNYEYLSKWILWIAAYQLSGCLQGCFHIDCPTVYARDP